LDESLEKLSGLTGAMYCRLSDYQTHSTILELRSSLQALAEPIAGRVALFAP